MFFPLASDYRERRLGAACSRRYLGGAGSWGRSCNAEAEKQEEDHEYEEYFKVCGIDGRGVGAQFLPLRG